MEIRNNFAYRNNPYFGIKVPVKTALEAASGRFFDEGKIANPRQLKLLENLGNIKPLELYSGEVAEALRNLRIGIRKQHPDLALAADRIGKTCDEFDRTFLPEDEIKFNKLLQSTIKQEIENIGKNNIDIEPFSLKDLVLEKYEN